MNLGGHSYFWDYIVPLSRFGLAPKMCFFCVMAGLSVCGLWLTAWDLVLAYLLAVFAFSPGQCSYYWAIPLVAIACSQLRWFVAFNIVGLIAMWYRSGLLCHLGRVVPTCPHFIGSFSQVLSVGIAVIVLVLHVIKSVRHKRM